MYQNWFCDQRQFVVVLCGLRKTKAEKFSEHLVEVKEENLTSLINMIKVKNTCQSAVMAIKVYDSLVNLIIYFNIPKYVTTS